MKKITLLITLSFITYFANSQTISEFSTGYNIISGIAVTPENEVYVAEYNSQKIYQLDSNGNKTLFTTVESGSFINDMDFDTDGNLFVADPNGKVLKVDDMGVASTYAFFNGLYPSDLVINNGEIFNAVGGGSTGYIYKLTSDISYVLITQILNSKGITIDANGDLYVANFTNHSLDLVTQTGTVTSLLTNIGNPRDVAIAPDGMVYVTTYNDAGTSNKIIKYNPTTNTASDFVTTNLDEPWQLVIDNLGNMFVTNRGTESVIKIYDDSLLPPTTDPTIVYIPDVNFKAELVNNTSINTNMDSEIQKTEAAAYTGFIGVSNKNISNLTGIEEFTEITLLNCSRNSIASINVSNNSNLTYLNCSNNSLTTLDISSNTSLKTLLCTDNQLSILDVTQLNDLETLWGQRNEITNINLSNNTSLVTLAFSNNQLSTLDVTNNNALESLTIGQNSLSNLDLSMNTNLDRLDFFNNDISTIDLSNNTELTFLNSQTNDMTSIDLSNNTKLVEIKIGSNYLIDQLDLTNNVLLEKIDFQGLSITTLDLSNNINLVDIIGSSSPMIKMDLRNGNNTSITRFSILNANNLSCVFVDDKDYSDSNWTNPNPGNTNFVETEAECTTLSIDDFQIANFKIYPNPTSTILNINIPFKKAIIYNIQGKEIMKSYKQSINIENLLNGVYFIQFDNSKNKTFKFIKE